ncbi:interaptin [Eurosta solidaginis]|uniref:interaptin n=1 Tax=Eurosta solidaginis TaxID=178769 RepID=UPI0035317120
MEANNVQLCRICISTNVGCTQMISIFGEDSLWQKITTLADVKIEKGDTLPQQVCVTCAKNAISACLFKKKCEDADNFFRQQLLIQKFESRSSAANNVAPVQPEVDSTDQAPEIAAMDSYGGSDYEDQPNQTYISASGQLNGAMTEEDDGEIKFPYGKQPFDFHSIRLMHEYMQQQLSKINGSHKDTSVGHSGANSDDEDPLPLMPEVEILTPSDEVVVSGSNHDNPNVFGGIEQPTLRGYQCPDCFQIFEMKQILKAHMQSVHGTQGPVYECSNCKKTYFYKRFLEKHIRRGRCVKKRRNQTRPMQCSDCHVLFPTGHHLGWHKRTGCPLRAAKMPFQQLLKQNIVEYNNFPKRVGVRKPENALYMHNRKLHMANNKRKGRTRIKLDSKKIALAKQLILREATTTVIANELNISRTFAWRLRKSLVNGVSLHERVIDTNGDECDETTAQPMAADSTDQQPQAYPLAQQGEQFVHSERMVKQEKSESDEESEECGAQMMACRQESEVVSQEHMEAVRGKTIALPEQREQIYSEQTALATEKHLRTERKLLTENCKLMEHHLLQLQKQQQQANNVNDENGNDNDNEEDDDDDDDNDGDNDDDDDDNDDDNEDDDDDDDDDDDSNDNNAETEVTETTAEKTNDADKVEEIQAQKIQLKQHQLQQKYQPNDHKAQQQQNQTSSILSQQLMLGTETVGNLNQRNLKSHHQRDLVIRGKEVQQSSLSVNKTYPSAATVIHQIPVNLSIHSSLRAQINESEDRQISTHSTTGHAKKPRKPNVFIDDEKYSMAKTLVAQNASTMEIARALNVSQMTAWKVRDAIVKGLPLSYRNKRDGPSGSNGSSVCSEATGNIVNDSVDSQQLAHQLLLQQQLQQEKYRQEQLQLQQQQQQQQLKLQQKRILQQQQEEQQERLRLLQRQQQLKAQQLMQKQQQLQKQPPQKQQHHSPDLGHNGEQRVKSQPLSPPATSTNVPAPVKFVHPRRRLKAAEREQRDKEITREILELIREDSNIQYWKVSARLAEKGFPISPSSVCQKLKSMGIHRRWKPGDKPPMTVDMDQLKAVNVIAGNMTHSTNSAEESLEQQFDMGGAHFLSAFTR